MVSLFLDKSLQRPQSSSASRFTAGAFGFLTLTQCGERPELYGESSRFDTMPSQPSVQACLKIIAPSPLKCRLKATQSRTPRRSSASIALRRFDQVESAQDGRVVAKPVAQD